MKFKLSFFILYFRKITRAAPSLKSARFGTVMAAIVNITGMALEYFIGRELPDIPNWPLGLSMLTGFCVLVLTPRLQHETERGLISLLFLLNSSAVVGAMALRHGFYAAHLPLWVPFQANKLGCFIAALLAPDFFTGVIAIAAHAFSSILSFELFPEALQRRIAFGEPIASLAFGLAGVLTLISRFRGIQAENELRRLQARTLAAQSVARTVLRIKDMMNTPLQSISLATAIQSEQKERDDAAIKGLNDAVAELKKMNALLDKYEHLVDWKSMEERE